MDEVNFDQIVEDALNGLPKWAAAELDNVVVLVKKELFGPPAPWSFAQYASRDGFCSQNCMKSIVRCYYVNNDFAAKPRSVHPFSGFGAGHCAST